ncbi:uncharacterized protein METZ01_LOCUS434916 [marine metagenome]|uniref:Uncharacterized protein n=1 Tax=marine metagenome TaxID=408172 RepID=A0A382YFI4_9ZZZZ
MKKFVWPGVYLFLVVPVIGIISLSIFTLIYLLIG